MKIIILGAGGIGSLVGALLSKENDVLLIGRNEHVDKIKKDGLEISGCINKNFKVKADTKIKNIEEDSLIILTTKANDIEKSLSEIKDLIKKNNVILCLQNGLGNEELIKNIADCEVVRGITTIGTIFLEPGRIICSNTGKIYLEDFEISNMINNVFNKAGLKTEISKNIKERIWAKLMVNCAINPLTAIFKAKNGELLKTPEIINLIINEIVMVAEKENLNFNREESFKIIMEAIKNSAENKSSMLQDILKGRKTEIDFLNGKIAELGRKHKINVPVNEMLVYMVKFLEKR